jgi:hypothetical protein
MNWGNGMDWSQLMQRFPMLGQRFQGQGPFAGHSAHGSFGQPQQGGYDSSGINPHGMYNQGGPIAPPMGQQMPHDFSQLQGPHMGQRPQFGQQPPFPHNPGGFNPMGGLAAFLQRR